MGEAELTLLELVNALSDKQNGFFINTSLAFKQNGNSLNCKENVIKELDTLPFPRWD